MNEQVYDIIIVWWWASGIFCASQISDNFSTIILEWSISPTQKLLLSAKWRWNITNKSINPSVDYVTDDSDFVQSAFWKFWVNDFLEFLEKNGIETKEEDFWRILVKSGKVLHFQEMLLNLVKGKGIPIMYEAKVESIERDSDWFFVLQTTKWFFKWKNVVISTGGPSFPKLWASGVAIEIAKNFNLDYSDFYPALVWFETEKDFSSLSGSSINWNLKIKKGNQIIYEQNGPILFTHRWLSGPAIFNASLFLRDLEYSKYTIHINVSSKEITKRLLSYLWFNVNKLDNYQISTKLKTVRWLSEAKVCWWWVKTKNLTSEFECKSISGLYFIWECLDVTWKTWGFNLQRCRTSGAVCAKWLNAKLWNW